MSQQRQTKVPNPLRNPMVVKETVNDLKALLPLAEQKSKEDNRWERDRYGFIRVRAFLAELEKNADAKLGDQLRAFE